MLLQIEVKRKMLGRSVTFGPKSVEKRFQQQNFFELTTPIAHLSARMICPLGAFRVWYARSFLAFFDPPSPLHSNKV